MVAVELITDALRTIGVLSEIDNPSAEAGARAVLKLNDMMATLAEDGIDLGFAPLPDVNETVYLPPGQIGPIKNMLGLLLCTDYGADPSPMLVQQAQSGYERLLRQAVIAAMTPTIARIPSGDAQGGSFDIERGY